MYKLTKRHKHKYFSPRKMATTMAVIYLLMILSPLASLSLYSANIAHATTGECSGDCNICGCSLESRASKTCCCAQKLQQQMPNEQYAEETDTPACCKKESSPKKVIIAKCGCPCKNGTSATIANSTFSELIPCYFSEKACIPLVTTHHSIYAYHVTSRHIEPPDPPPRLT